MITKFSEEFEHAGLACRISGTKVGHFCGYVQAPEAAIGSIRWTSTYDDKLGLLEPDVSVHGGITYGPDPAGWVGFDCGHAGDRCVYEGEITAREVGALQREWTAEKVREETERLAEQIAETIEE